MFIFLFFLFSFSTTLNSENNDFTLSPRREIEFLINDKAIFILQFYSRYGNGSQGGGGGGTELLCILGNSRSRGPLAITYATPPSLFAPSSLLTTLRSLFWRSFSPFLPCPALHRFFEEGRDATRTTPRDRVLSSRHPLSLLYSPPPQLSFLL